MKFNLFYFHTYHSILKIVNKLKNNTISDILIKFAKSTKTNCKTIIYKGFFCQTIFYNDSTKFQRQIKNEKRNPDE